MSIPDEDKGYEVLRKIRDTFMEMVETVPSPLKEQMRETMEFRQSLTLETDRGSALMAAAFLDDRLKLLLSARLVNDRKIARRAFDFNGALGTFSARIDFAYLIGLIPKNAHRDLHLIRNIRNKFAHVAAPIGFNHEEIKPFCNSLVFHGVRPEINPGAKFRRSAMALLTLILQSTNESEHIVAQEDKPIADGSDGYKMVSEIWAATTDLPFPLENQHIGSRSDGF